MKATKGQKKRLHELSYYGDFEYLSFQDAKRLIKALELYYPKKRNPNDKTN